VLVRSSSVAAMAREFGVAGCSTSSQADPVAIPGLLRDYSPKGTSLRGHTATDLARVAEEFNQRPQKTLGWRTPHDLFTALEPRSRSDIPWNPPIDTGENPRSAAIVAAGAQHGDVGVDLGADARHRRLRDPAVTAQRLHEVIDLSRGGAGDVGGHDHRPRRPVDTSTRLEQLREERTRAELRDGGLDVTGRGRQQLRAWALRSAVRSGDRSPGAAPISVVSSASISSCRATVRMSRSEVDNVASVPASRAARSDRADWVLVITPRTGAASYTT